MLEGGYSGVAGRGVWWGRVVAIEGLYTSVV